MVSVSWELVRRALAERPPVDVEEPSSTKAAVAVVLRAGGAGLELLLIRRAEHEKDPWSGHISFPGGRSEPGDGELLDTAVRETREETGLDLRRDAEMLGRLDEIRAMARGRPVDLTISPFVFRLLRHAPTVPNHEVVSLHWLPLDRLTDPGCRSTMEYTHLGSVLELPCLRVDELVVWGLTYRMFDNLRQLLEEARGGLNAVWPGATVRPPMPPRGSEGARKGAPPAGDLLSLVHRPIDLPTLLESSSADGAVCLFVGVVRDENRGRSVIRLEYEAYEEMALSLMEEIVHEARRRFPVTAVRLVHRLGRLEIGEASVAVAAVSPHRDEAFAACRFVIDTLKAKVPIWKKEHYADGTAWLDGPGASPGDD